MQSIKLKGKLGTNGEKEAPRMPLDKTGTTKEGTDGRESRIRTLFRRDNFEISLGYPEVSNRRLTI